MARTLTLPPGKKLRTGRRSVRPALAAGPAPEPEKPAPAKKPPWRERMAAEVEALTGGDLPPVAGYPPERTSVAGERPRAQSCCP